MENHKDLVRDVYRTRADRYDDGWHADLAEDFVKWVDPKPGQYVLDLACGTGLLARPLAVRVGKQGRVVAVDLTKEMIDVARSKEIQADASDVDWIVADITSDILLSFPSIQDTIEEHGGFDVISVCSALVLLPDQQAALSFWVEKLLKKGGSIIIDTPTENISLQMLMTYYLPKALGRSTDLAQGRLWITSRDSLEDLFRSAGLEVEQNIATKSYGKEVWHAADEHTALETLRTEVRNTYRWIDTEGRLGEAEKVWPGLWENALMWHNGTKVVDGGHRLYVCVGRKSY